MAERCTVIRSNGLQCPETDTIAVTAGCVHEHVAGGFMCPECLAMTEEHEMGCTRCYDGANPHHCAIVIVARETIEA